MTSAIQNAKQVVRSYQAAFDSCPPAELAECLAAQTSSDYRWRGMHPFYEQDGAQAVARVFWQPL